MRGISDPVLVPGGHTGVGRGCGAEREARRHGEVAIAEIVLGDVSSGGRGQSRRQSESRTSMGQTHAVTSRHGASAMFVALRGTALSDAIGGARARAFATRIRREATHNAQRSGKEATMTATTEHGCQQDALSAEGNSGRYRLPTPCVQFERSDECTGH